MNNIKIMKIISVIIIMAIFFICLLNKDYKKQKNGNNKNIQEIEKYILNVKSYRAKIEVTTSSNKNANYYKFEQEVRENEFCKQITISPKELEGMRMTYENGILKIENTKYNLSIIYNDYKYITDNSLFLTSFIQGYKEAKKQEIEEKDNKIKMSYNSNVNKYNYKQVLYIDRASLNPINLQIFDINNSKKIDIIYTEIELNI